MNSIKIDEFITMTGVYCNRAVPEAQKSLFVTEYMEWANGIKNFSTRWLEDAFKAFLRNAKTREIPRPYEIIQLIPTSQIKYEESAKQEEEPEGTPVPPEIARQAFKEIMNGPPYHSPTFDTWAQGLGLETTKEAIEGKSGKPQVPPEKGTMADVLTQLKLV
jgi:hypothetical protein